MLAIVALHVSANGVNRLPIASADWWLAESVNALCRAGVPLFLMLTGALLLPKQISDIAVFYRRRCYRLAPALVFWSLFYVLWSALKAQWKQQNYTLNDAAMAIVSGAPYFHLWFVYMLLGVYLVLPFLQRYWLRLLPAQKTRLLLSALVLQQVGVLLYFYLDGPAVPWPLWFIGYLPYVWLGAWLAERPVRASHHLGSFVGWLGFSAIIAGLFYYQHVSVGAEPFYYSHHRLSIPVLASALCLWHLLGASIVIPRYTAPLVAMSLSIYCIHPIWLDVSTGLLAYWTLPYGVALCVQFFVVLAATIASAISWGFVTRAVARRCRSWT